MESSASTVTGLPLIVSLLLMSASAAVVRSDEYHDSPRADRQASRKLLLLEIDIQSGDGV